MGGNAASIGVLVPAVKSEPEEEAPLPSTSAEPEKDLGKEEVDKDILCPICMQIIKEAFLTACGHSFCYTCIVTHLQNKSDCPCCSHFLTKTQLYPNFLLNKGCGVSVKELQRLLNVISEKKKKMEQEEAETNLQILLDFLVILKKQKLDELNEIQSDLHHIKEDIHDVEKHRIELYRRRDRYSVRIRMLADDPASKSLLPSSMDKHTDAPASRATTISPDQVRLSSSVSQNRKGDLKSSASPLNPRKDASGASDNQNLNQSGLALARKRRVLSQFNDLQDCYLQKRRYWARISSKQQELELHGVTREGYTKGLEDFQSVLSTFTRYSRLRVFAELRHSDLFHSANIVSSIEFDRDDELFATAGVSRRIKIFEFSSVVNEPEAVKFPVAEMLTRSKLSCLSWSKYTKNHIASSDYEGIVTVWDVTTQQI